MSKNVNQGEETSDQKDKRRRLDETIKSEGVIKKEEHVDDDEEDNNSSAVNFVVKKEERKKCPYLDTVNRQLLDFDMEKVCSVTLSNLNVYCCLICGKYFQGRGKSTPAYTHSVAAGNRKEQNRTKQNNTK